MDYQATLAGFPLYSVSLNDQSSEQTLHMEFLSDLWQFMMERKKWWLIPMIIAFVLLGLILIFAQSSAVAPFIYPVF